MLGFSFTEIILLAVIALVVIGPKQLPEVARNIGRFLNELKRTSSAFTREFRDNMDQVKIDPIRFDDPKPEEPTTHHHPATYTTATDASAEVTPATMSSEVLSPQFPLSPTAPDVTSPSSAQWAPSGLTPTEGTGSVASTDIASATTNYPVKKETGSHD